MLSYVYSFFNYIFPSKPDEDDDSNENYLADQLLQLEMFKETVCEEPEITDAPIPKNTVCFQKTGVITYMGDNYILIDGMLYFNISSCSLQLNTNDKVLYLGYKDDNDSIKVVRILEWYGTYWGEEDISEEQSFKVIEHVIIGMVSHREERNVVMKDSDLKFSLDHIQGTFVPVKGDWLELTCMVQFDDDKPSDIGEAQVLKVISYKALRRTIKPATVTQWLGDFGIADGIIYFNKQFTQNGFEPTVGNKVMVEAIESSQGNCTWRALKILAIDNNNSETQVNDEEPNFDIEKEKNIVVTHPLKFESIDYNDTGKIILNITNKSDQAYIIYKWIIPSKRKDSQIDIKPQLSSPLKLFPNQTYSFTVTCHPKFLGYAKECLIIKFKGFVVKRYIEINVINKILNNVAQAESQSKPLEEMRESMRKIVKEQDMPFVPGVKLIKPAAFIALRLKNYPVPNLIWSTILGDSEQTIYSSEYGKILSRIEENLPCLSQELNSYNYAERWHNLIYIEEVQADISMRTYDRPKAFLIPCQDYLCLEIEGLSERRPSLIQGDRVLVKDVWDSNTSRYEGFIFAIKGNLVLMKFSPRFHERYSGSDISIQFHFSRSVYKKMHNAIDWAVKYLGRNFLFPAQVMVQSPQIQPERLEQINWFNKSLNKWQKDAVQNILLGESRPMPYCIFGPPGTGKTMTVIETILQMLTFRPDSRILVAASSNSAANLITERLLQYRETFSDSIIRLIANYLVDSDNIPDVIKPFCATLDIARDDTTQVRQSVQNGIQLHCQTKFVGRHRVTIATCICFGTLAQMGLPLGHFTHVIVDEAGQATEPEIMIPLTFIDKQSGQIVLAGDPMQLGPVVLSRYAKEFGFDESFMWRILETFPYQKDYDAFENGYNNKLVTKLNDNYRSLEEVLALPSEMFYDSSLVAKVDRNKPWISKITGVLSEFFELPNTMSGGGIFVYGIRGCNSRAKDSPSWFNPQEASMVALTTCKLYKKGIATHDIGIITPYIAQIKHLRLLFDAMALPQPKIGSVEEFQGQERPIIMISTVRSTESMLEDDYKHCLGFVKNPKRLNVALTRAKIAVLLFCDPHLLCRDMLWKKVITKAVQEEKYMGCDLPVGCMIKNNE